MTRQFFVNDRVEVVHTIPSSCPFPKHVPWTRVEDRDEAAFANAFKEAETSEVALVIHTRRDTMGAHLKNVLRMKHRILAGSSGVTIGGPSAWPDNLYILFVCKEADVDSWLDLIDL